MVPHYPFSVECEPPYGSPSPSENLHQGRALARLGTARPWAYATGAIEWVQCARRCSACWCLFRSPFTRAVAEACSQAAVGHGAREKRCSLGRPLPWKSWGSRVPAHRFPMPSISPSRRATAAGACRAARSWSIPALAVADFPTGFARPPAPLTAEVRAGGAACRIDSFVRAGGQITGAVVDASGKAIPGFVTIRPADQSSDPEEAASVLRSIGLPTLAMGLISHSGSTLTASNVGQASRPVAFRPTEICLIPRRSARLGTSQAMG